MKKLILTGLVLVMASVIIFVFIKKPSMNVPLRLLGIPEQAKWVGGADGGNWYEVVKVLPNNSFRVRIYNENTGEIETDTTFSLNPECHLKEIDSVTLVKSIAGYDGDRILLTIPENEQRCFLSSK